MTWAFASPWGQGDALWSVDVAEGAPRPRVEDVVRRRGIGNLRGDGLGVCPKGGLAEHGLDGVGDPRGVFLVDETASANGSAVFHLDEQSRPRVGNASSILALV